MKFGEGVGGEITASVSEVLREIAEDIDELEALSEETAVFQEGGEWEGGKARKESGTNVRPEFPNASRDGIGVGEEGIGVWERRWVLWGGVSKPGEVRALPLDDGGEDVLEGQLNGRGLKRNVF